jgi:hypothetical protein
MMLPWSNLFEPGLQILEDLGERARIASDFSRVRDLTLFRDPDHPFTFK